MKPNVVVLIATKNRPKQLDIALDTVSKQTILPDKVIVVSDGFDKLFKETEIVVSNKSTSINVELIRNKRTKNLSGAINTALEVLSDSFLPEQTFCAILDDDDEWTPDHIEKCLSVFENENGDVIISGLIRHESVCDDGRFLSIPTNLTVHDFLIGNPNIQGSNLFVRLSSFLECGGFDESLCSTTDRDLCIRLLNVGANFSMTSFHTVHHWALPNKNRLSDPGSPQKKDGLVGFYQKYCNIMTKEEKELFIQRAKQIFKINIKFSNSTDADKKETIESNSLIFGNIDSSGLKIKPTNYVPILIGFTASSPILADRLLGDLNNFLNGFPNHCVLICDNCFFLNHSNLYKKYSSLNLKIISKNIIKSDIDCGNFGTGFVKINSNSGISAGRTILHHYLYLETKEIPGCSIWVLDDDIRLDYLSESYRFTVLTMDDFQSAVIKLKNENASIGVGKITGDAPLPIHSTLRTQLLDITYELQSRLNDGLGPVSYGKVLSSANHSGCDYYYDYSEKHFNHLEMPDNHVLSNLTDLELVQSIIAIVNGKSVSRPLVRTEDFSNGLVSGSNIPVIPRGGNTVIINAEVLRDFPNNSPQFNGLNARRGDTLWSLLNSHVGARKVVPLILPVRQDRLLTDEIQNLNILASDFVGSSLVKALTEYYNLKIFNQGRMPRRTSIRFNESDIKQILIFFERNIISRICNVKINAYRIRGLIRINKSLLTHSKFSRLDSTSQALKILEKLEVMYSLENVNSVTFKMKTSISGVKSFLSNLYRDTESYKHLLPILSDIEYTESAFRKMLKEENIDDSKIMIIECGNEAIIASDGHFVYKFFFLGTAGFEDGDIEVLKEMVGKDFTHICKLDRIICTNGNLLLILEYVSGNKYEGGHYHTIRDMLNELKINNLIFTNIYPDNLIVSSENIKLVDIGHSWFPYSEYEFRKMCIRAYLMYRWHFRDDLKELMSIAMSDESIIELSGFDLFFKSMEKTTKKEMLDPKIIELCNNYNYIFDFGCGRGSVAEILAKNDKSVIGYDIDIEVIKKNKMLKQVATYICIDELESLKNSGKTFDCVICSLVLCCINDLEVEDVMNDVRKLIGYSGTAVVAICNPASSFVEQTLLHTKLDVPKNVNDSTHFIYHKITNETGNVKTEYHRPLSWYKDLFHRCGFLIDYVDEIQSIDIKNLLPISEFVLFRLNPLIDKTT